MSAQPVGAVAADVQLPVGDAILEGDLVLPEGAVGIDLFAHGHIHAVRL